MIAAADQSASWYSRESEEYVLGAILIDPSRIPEVRGIVSTEDFSATNGDVYGAILGLYDEIGGIDLRTLIVRLKQRRFASPDENWPLALADLAVKQPGIWYDFHARVVRDLAAKRKVQGVVNAMNDALGDRTIEPIESVHEVEGIWREAGVSDMATDHEQVPTLMEAVERVRDMLEGRESSRPPVATGLHDLDDHLNGGLHAGSLTVVAAETGKGKTAIGLQTAREAARRGTVLYVSVEMDRDELLARLLSSEAEVPYSALQKGLLSTGGTERANNALLELGALPIRAPAQKAPSVEEIGVWARRYRDSEHLVLVVVDYLQILRVSRGREKDSREQQVNHMALSLKQLAADLGVPVLTMSQLNDDGKVRESRGIEHHADFVMVVECDHTQVVRDGVLEATVNIRKGRRTGIGQVPVLWEPRYVRFKSLAKDEDQYKFDADRDF